MPGACRVVCFSPRHDLSLPELSLAEVEAVVRAWTEQTQALSARPGIQYVQVFENKGAMMGASNPHPHSQVWATAVLPNEPAKMARYINDLLRILAPTPDRNHVLFETAIKGSVARYVGAETISLTSTGNPLSSMATTVTRTWSDLNNDRTIFNPDLTLQTAELGPNTNANFGKVVQTTTVDPGAV